MKVPLIDLRAQYLSCAEEIDRAVARVLAKGQYVMGEEVELFEEEWARYCKARYAVGVSSGTDALYLTFRALALVREDVLQHVAVPTRTFIATAEAALRAGWEVTLYDGELGHIWNGCDLTVNLYGEPLPLGKGLVTVEDAAQSHGVPLRGDVSCHSFYPTKALGAVGQAGTVVTNDARLASLVKVLRNHGEQWGRFRHEHLSGNYRMDELQAAILRAKLPHLDAWNSRRKQIARMYLDLLQGCSGIRLPIWNSEHIWHIFNIQASRRDALGAFLTVEGIQTAVRYPIPLHLQPALASLGYKQGDFPDAEQWANESLSLPIYDQMSAAQVEYVAGKVIEWVRRSGEP